MPSVISTASADCWYDTKTFNPNKDMWKRDKGVVIKGGANMGGKGLITPKGVVTHVTEEELEFLETVPAFQRHKAKGHITVVKSAKPDVEKVTAGMTKKDKSAPLTDSDFLPGGRQFDGKTEAPVVGKPDVEKKKKGAKAE